MKPWLKRTLASLTALSLMTPFALLIADLPNRPKSPDILAIAARAFHYRVHIRRDNFGVPHILGHTDPDVAFGLAYAHCEDDYPTLQQAILTNRGTLSGAIGFGGTVTDYLIQLFRVRQTVNDDYASKLPPDVRSVLEAYADGLNYYATLHPATTLPGLLPVTGQDIDAGFAFRTPFFYGLDHVLKSLTEHGETAPPTGSNGVAIAPSRAADAATRLLINSHQPYTGQVAWYEAILQSDDHWHVAGGFFPGSPFMLHGHNAHLGWANTVNQPNLTTVYRLTINPENETEYRFDGQWLHFEKSEARLRIRLWGPFYITIHKPIEWSVQGPVFRTARGVFALRYAGMLDIRQPEQYYRLDKAENLTQWRAAMALQELPSINYIYADEHGNIGYVYNGLFPQRPNGI